MSTKDRQNDGVSPTRRCFVCGTRAISKCGACKSAYYCSRECQAIDWVVGSHNVVCSKLASRAPLETSFAPRISSTAIFERPKSPPRERMRTGPIDIGFMSNLSSPPQEESHSSTDLMRMLERSSSPPGHHCGISLFEPTMTCVVPGEKWGAFRDLRFAATPFPLDAYPEIGSLGKGSYGSVTRRSVPATLGEVAIKLLALEKPDPQNASYEISDTVLHELEMRNLDHPNVTGTCTAGFVKGDPSQFAIVMDVANGNLFKHTRDKIADNVNKRRPPFTPPFGELETAFIIYQLLKALAYQQSQLVANLDVKPENVLVSGIKVTANDLPLAIRSNYLSAWPGSDPEKTFSMMLTRVKIIDFGLSMPYVVDRIYASPQYTLWYRPPEVLLGNRWATYAGDSWAAGLVAYEVAVGTPLFATQTEFDTIIQIAQLLGAPSKALRSTWFPLWNKNYPEFKNKFRATVDVELEKYGHPESLARLLERLISIDPSKRPAAFDVLNDPYFVETGVVDLWNNLFGESPIPRFPPKVSSDTGRVDPRWALEVFEERRFAFKNRVETEMEKSGLSEFSVESPDAGTNLRRATRMTFLLACNSGCGFVVPYTSVALLYRYALTIGAKKFGSDLNECFLVAIACHRLAIKYRTSFGLPDLVEFVNFAKKWNIPTTEDGIVDAERKVAEVIDYDFSQPTVYDYAKQLASINGLDCDDEIMYPGATIPQRKIGTFAVALMTGAFLLMDNVHPMFSLPETALLALSFAAKPGKMTTVDTNEIVDSTTAKLISNRRLLGNVVAAIKAFPTQPKETTKEGWKRFAASWDRSYPGIERAFESAMVDATNELQSDLRSSDRRGKK